MSTALPPVKKQRPWEAADPSTPAPGLAPPADTTTNRQGYGFGAPGQDNARALLASRGYAVGKAAWAANPEMKRLRWRDVGVDIKDRAQQDAFYGHADVGGVDDPERVAHKMRLRSLIGDPRFQGTGGGPGGGGGAGGPQQSLEGATEALIRGLMSGKEGPYNDEAISRLTGQATARRAGDLRNANEEAYLAAVRGGTAASPGASATLAANAREARGGLAGDVGSIRQAATTENFKAKLQGLEQAQATISRNFQDRWNKATDATQRLQIEKEYDAAMKKIDADKELAQQSINAAGAAAGRGRAWELEDREAQWAREDMLYQRDLPLLLTQMSLGSYGE